MDFQPSELIRKKRFGHTHTREELKFWVQSYVRNQIPDYQMSAWLMAVCLNGMTAEETAVLTQEMRDSGVVLDLGRLGFTVDKHSTGGVGDKTSIILAPLLAACGATVPMMAGRGLGHTGGTLDKLESISGFRVGLTFKEFETQLERLGCAIIGQTLEICPADRKLYALRDVTGTVDCMPLICASIMSKKLAEGMSGLVLDVKYGSGAFMKSQEQAEQLALNLKSIAEADRKKCVAMITRMDEPLGRYVGNSVEIFECLEIMRGHKSTGEGKGYDDTLELTLALAAQMLLLAGLAADDTSAKKLALAKLSDGSCLKKFEEMCAAQGGDLKQGQTVAQHEVVITSHENGHFNYIDLEKLGLAAVQLGAGRLQQTDRLDLSAGIEVFCAQGDKVQNGQPLLRLFTNDRSRLEPAMAVAKQSFQIQSAALKRSPLIAKVLPSA